MNNIMSQHMRAYNTIYQLHVLVNVWFSLINPLPPPPSYFFLFSFTSHQKKSRDLSGTDTSMSIQFLKNVLHNTLQESPELWCGGIKKFRKVSCVWRFLPHYDSYQFPKQ